jgi:hypothetical protein
MLQEPAIDERLREVRAVVTIAEKAAVQIFDLGNGCHATGTRD